MKKNTEKDVAEIKMLLAYQALLTNAVAQEMYTANLMIADAFGRRMKGPFKETIDSDAEYLHMVTDLTHHVLDIMNRVATEVDLETAPETHKIRVEYSPEAQDVDVKIKRRKEKR